MKAKLEFNLPEDREEFDMAVNGDALWCFVNNLNAWLRVVSKFEDRDFVTVADLRQKINELLNDAGVEDLFD